MAPFGEPSSRDTSQRRAIRSAVESAGRPLSAAEILASARREVPGLGIATVYRAVRRMQEEGMLRQVELPGDAPRYEASGKEHHHHFHCRSCSRVYEVEACPGEFIMQAPPGFSVEDHELILYGRCPTCRTRRRAGAPRARSGRAAPRGRQR